MGNTTIKVRQGKTTIKSTASNTAKQCDGKARLGNITIKVRQAARRKLTADKNR